MTSLNSNSNFVASHLRNHIVYNILNFTANKNEFHKDQVYAALHYLDLYWQKQFISDDCNKWLDVHVQKIALCCLNLATKIFKSYHSEYKTVFHRSKKTIDINGLEFPLESIFELETHVLMILQWDLCMTNSLMPLYWFKIFCSKFQNLFFPDNRLWFHSSNPESDLLIQNFCCQFDLILCSMSLLPNPSPEQQLEEFCLIAFSRAIVKTSINYDNAKWTQNWTTSRGHFLQALIELEQKYELNVQVQTPNQWIDRKDNFNEWIYESMKQKQYSWSKTDNNIYLPQAVC